MKKTITDAAQAISKATKKVDGWANIITGMNIQGKDARASARAKYERLEYTELENLYAADSMATKIVDLPVDEAFAPEHHVTAKQADALDDDLIEELKQAAEELELIDKVKEAAKLARLYGGAGVLKIYDDSLEMESPADPTSKLKNLIVLARRELWIQPTDINSDIRSKWFGKPVFYELQQTQKTRGQAMLRIHASRMIRFDGQYLPHDLKIKNNYWHDSALTKPYNAIRNYAEAHESANAALKDLSVAVFKIKDLADHILADAHEKILVRTALVNLTKSIARAVMLDADGEEFEYKGRALTGAGELVKAAEERLAAETNIPKILLLGQSPQGGLGQKGDPEFETWYNFVESYRASHITPPLSDLYSDLARSMGHDLDIELKFDPHWSLDQKEESELRLRMAQVDKLYLDQGVLDPSEVRASRFGPDGYTLETTIDPDITPLPPAINPEPIDLNMDE